MKQFAVKMVIKFIRPLIFKVFVAQELADKYTVFSRQEWADCECRSQEVYSKEEVSNSSLLTLIEKRVAEFEKFLICMAA